MKASTGGGRHGGSSSGITELRQNFLRAYVTPGVPNVPVLQTMEGQPGPWRQWGRKILQIQQPEHEQSA